MPAGDNEDPLTSAHAMVVEVLGPPNSVNNPFTEADIKTRIVDANFDTEAVIDGLMREGEEQGCEGEWQSHRALTLCMLLRKRPVLEAYSLLGRAIHSQSDTVTPCFPLLSTGTDDSGQVETAVSRLSLNGTGTHAQGISGLLSRGKEGGGGGRAGLAKRNLASLAPGGLPGVSDSRSFGPKPGAVGNRSSAAQPPPPKPAGKSKLALLAEQRKAASSPSASASTSAPLSPSKRPSESVSGTSTQDSSLPLQPQAEQTARPSKLMALAQQRKGNASAGSPNTARTTADTKPSQPSAGADAGTKPLSKLQQRALAAKLEREAKEKQAKERDAAHKGPQDAATAEGMDIDDAQANARILPGGLPESMLFPSAHGSVRAGQASEVGRILSASHLTVPPSSLRMSLGEVPSEAFSEPSPDDKVLKAREGSRLR